jgi:hypothetical protein
VVTEPLDIHDMKRPRRRFAGLFDGFLACPYCPPTGGAEMAQRLAQALEAKQAGREPPKYPPFGLRVVVYRRGSVRLECRACGVRFSIEPLQLADAIERRAETAVEREGLPRVTTAAQFRATGAAEMPNLVTVTPEMAHDGVRVQLRKGLSFNMPAGVKRGTKLRVKGMELEVRLADPAGAERGLAEELRALDSWNKAMRPRKRFSGSGKRR